MSEAYRRAGVDLQKGQEAVSRIQQWLKSAADERVLPWPRGFSGLYDLTGLDYREPVLVAGADGVGTKLKLAFRWDGAETVGQDCVAMCVNDVLCAGARPLFFLDYLAVARLEPEQVERVVKGIAEACRTAGMALLGGETAEMPGFYQPGEYELAGFAVGIVERSRRLDGTQAKPGDVLLGLPSNGLHANGFSLVRQLVAELPPDTPVGETTLRRELLKPTRIYTRTVLELLADFPVHGLAHITGGGWYENLPRAFPTELQAVITRGSWPVPPIFTWLRDRGDLAEEEMFAVFNMGIGMVVILPPTAVDAARKRLEELGEAAFVLGELRPRKRGEQGLCFA